jgi:prophage regulatory protein
MATAAENVTPEIETLPPDAYLRLPQILGDPRAVPPRPALFPVCKSVWWAGIKTGKYPKPHRLSTRAVGWRVSDIRALLERGAT